MRLYGPGRAAIFRIATRGKLKNQAERYGTTSGDRDELRTLIDFLREAPCRRSIGDLQGMVRAVRARLGCSGNAPAPNLSHQLSTLLFFVLLVRT
jgi:hypothetical protein